MNEYEDALRRAFVYHRADYIVISSRREKFQIESATYGIDKGWLRGEWKDSDEQATAWVCRLTDEGKKHFGIGKS